MSEEYSGVKFKTIFKEKKKLKNEGIEELNNWCKSFSELDLAPEVAGGYAGNLSFRIPGGFVITAAGADLGNLSDEDFVEVIGVDMNLKQIFVCGLKEPSSESFLHHAIYMKRQDIFAVFHGHDELVLKYNDKLNFPVTENEQPYGSMELMDEVVKILDNLNYILIKNHGFLSLGETMSDAGNDAVLQHQKALKLVKSPPD